MEINNRKLVLTDRQYIESLFSIVDKQSAAVPFIYNSVQEIVDSRITAVPGRKIINIIVKSRKQGCSSLVLAKFTSRCLRHKYRKAVTISHEQKSTERLLLRAKFFVDNLPVKVPLSGDSRQELSFKETQSSFWIGTAGSKAFGRGDDITDLHISELDWYEYPDVITGLIEAVVPGGTIVIETTGNGYGSKTHRMVERAQRGESDYNVIFVPWFASEEYYLDPPENFKPDQSELDLMRLYNLNLGQVYWRRCKILDMDAPELFPQEYPATIEDAFQTESSAQVVIPFEFVRPCAGHDVDNRRGLERILISCDVAGFGDDRTVIYAIDRGRILYEHTVILRSCDPFEISARCELLFDQVSAGAVVVDTIGEGAGVVANLKRMIGEDKVFAFNSAERINEDDVQAVEGYEFGNRRSQAWWKARQLFRDNIPSIPDDPDLISELTNVRYTIKGGKIYIEPKSDLKKANRLGRSPDKADALIMGLFYMDRCPQKSEYHVEREHSTQMFSVIRQLPNYLTRRQN